jgi:hypothetical protein
MNETGAKRGTWFWVNVVTLCVLAPWATYWFQRHFELYFTEIVVVGGAFSLWVLLRAMWAVFEKTTRVEPAEYSRKLLALPDITGALIVAVVTLAILWFHTASIYVTYEGATGEGEYLVEVVRKSDRSPIVPAVSLTAANSVAGRPFLWQRKASELECRILRPVKYEILPCTLEPGHSTRIAVPGNFAPREFHLVRIVPSKTLYNELAAVDEKPQLRYDLELERQGKVATLTDLRRETIYTGAAASEMPIIMGLEPPGSLEHHLQNRLLAKGNDPESVAMATAILSSATRTWPTFYLRTGDQLKLTVRVTHPQGGSGSTTVFEGFPIKYTVTADKVQTAWLPE